MFAVVFRTWRDMPLVRRFGLAGGVVMLVAMLLVGFWVTARIERAVIDNTASATALYMESFISPLSQELAREDRLSDPAKFALDEMMRGTPLGKRIVSYKIWKPGGYIVQASDEAIVGETLPPTEAQLRAWAGEVTAKFEDLREEENRPEAALGIPLLEIYSPVREVWSGDVIAVAEFYAIEDTLASDLTTARRQSWLFVAGVFVCSGLCLYGIVQAGGRQIDAQQARLLEEAAHSRTIASQNADLRQRAVGASARAAAQTERTLRQVSADLHDGPAQYLALAALRLDRVLPDTSAGHDEAEAIRAALNAALTEIRTLSRGLSLPDLENTSLKETVNRAVEIHQRHTECVVDVSYTGPRQPSIDQSTKICAYRLLQESLSNVTRHAPGVAAHVAVAVSADCLEIAVADDGPGFDPTTIVQVRKDGGQGLSGLRDRAESIGGELDVEAAPGRGTKLRLRLPLVRGGTQ